MDSSDKDCSNRQGLREESTNVEYHEREGLYKHKQFVFETSKPKMQGNDL